MKLSNGAPTKTISRGKSSSRMKASFQATKRRSPSISVKPWSIRSSPACSDSWRLSRSLAASGIVAVKGGSASGWRDHSRRGVRAAAVLQTFVTLARNW